MANGKATPCPTAFPSIRFSLPPADGKPSSSARGNSCGQSFPSFWAIRRVDCFHCFPWYFDSRLIFVALSRGSAMHTTIFHRLGLLALVSLALCNSPASAAPRKWKDVTGKHTTEAEFVELDGNTLRLKRSDGKEITIQLDRLGVEERMFAIRESRLRAATPPELSAKGKELSIQLVSEVKAAADPYSLKKKVEHRDIEEGLAPALQALLKRGEELVTLESRRA